MEGCSGGPTARHVMAYNEDIIVLVLSYLPINTLRQLSAVNTTWQRLVQVVKKRRRFIKWSRDCVTKLAELDSYKAMLDMLMIEPCAVLMFADFCPYKYGLFRESIDSSDEMNATYKYQLVHVDLMKQRLADTKLLVGNTSYAIGTSMTGHGTTSTGTRTVMDFVSSTLFIPTAKGVNVVLFSYTDHELERMKEEQDSRSYDLAECIGVPQQHNGDCVVVLYYDDDILDQKSTARWFTRRLRACLRAGEYYNTTFAGGFLHAVQPGVVPKDQLPRVAGLIIHGASIRAASVVIPKAVRTMAAVEPYFDQLKSTATWHDIAPQITTLPYTSSQAFALVFDRYRFFDYSNQKSLLAEAVNSQLGVPVFGYAGMEASVVGCNFLPQLSEEKQVRVDFSEICPKSFDYSYATTVLLVSIASKS